MKAPDDKIGKKVLCSNCGSPVKVPAADSVAVESVTGPSGASERASELLRGAAGTATTGTKPRKHFAFDDEGPEETPGYDVAATLRQMGIVLLPGLAAIAVVVVGAYWLSSRIIFRDHTPPLGTVEGTITLDGQPLKGARITFDPKIGKDSDQRVSSSFGKTDASGRYRLVYLKDKPGAVIGPHRVTIEATQPRRGVPIAVRFENQGKLTAEVKKGHNPINFDLKSPRRR
jgi:hypothetical protein